MTAPPSYHHLCDTADKHGLTVGLAVSTELHKDEKRGLYWRDLDSVTVSGTINGNRIDLRESVLIGGLDHAAQRLLNRIPATT